MIETPIDGEPNRLHAYYGMQAKGQVRAFWVDDDNNEINSEGKPV